MTLELIAGDCLARYVRAFVCLSQKYIHLTRTHVARSNRDEEIDGGKRRARKGERRK